MLTVYTCLYVFLQIFMDTFPAVVCDESTWRSIAQVARYKAGITKQLSQVQRLLSYLVSRRGDNGEVQDFLRMDWEPYTESLRRVFFTSGLMMAQFKQYGQFVVMDATCKINRFGMPLVLLVGVDDTHTTSIFGMGLIKVEDIQSYIWLLSTFKQAVGTPHSTHAVCSHQVV